jgi:3-dehydroquinate dehydratase-2
MPQTVLIINGPNLGNLGKREPDIYGTQGMDYVFAEISKKGCKAEYFQSNHEGQIIDRLEQARTEFLDGKIIGIIINAGAFTHTSLALADCLSWIKVPYAEVHISNILARAGSAKSEADTLRGKSLIAAPSLGIIAGFGLDSYILAVEALMRYKAKNSI